MLHKFFPVINVPTSINPFNVLIVCFILNIITIFICYRMVSDHDQKVDNFIFEHNNNPYKFHSCLEKFSVRLDELEDKVSIYTQAKCSE